MPSKPLPVPLIDMGVRAPEAGRIRLGIQAPTKGGKMRPTSIDTFRFTSPDRASIEQLAALYGGKVEAWNEPKASPKSQWQVISTSNEIPVYLVPDGLSVHYELWSGGGCQRRCDGVTVQLPEKVSEYDYELVDHNCLCVANGVRECDAHTRLQLLLPGIRFRGVWRLDTKGWNAQVELPGMYDLILQLGAQGQMVQALLGVERREKATVVGKRSFVVPRLSIAQSILELQAGHAAVGAIAAPSQPVATPALGPAASFDVLAKQDAWGDLVPSNADDPVDAEVIDDELLELEQRLRDDARQFGLSEDRYVSAIKLACANDRERMAAASAKLRAGAIEPLGFDALNKIQWIRHDG